MDVVIKLSQSQISDFESLASIDAETMVQIASVLSSSPNGILDLDSLTELLGLYVESSDHSTVMARQLVAIRSLAIRLGDDVTEVFAAINGELDKSAAQGKFLSSDKWKSVSPLFGTILESSGVRRVSTAISLNYDYANLLHRAKILTDIRPIFDEPASCIEAAVVSYTLRLNYSTAKGQCDLSIALDHSDILKLQEQCQRALKKAETSKKAMLNAQIDTEVSGASKKD